MTVRTEPQVDDHRGIHVVALGCTLCGIRRSGPAASETFQLVAGASLVLAFDAFARVGHSARGGRAEFVHDECRASPTRLKASTGRRPHGWRTAFRCPCGSSQAVPVLEMLLQKWDARRQPSSMEGRCTEAAYGCRRR